MSATTTVEQLRLRLDASKYAEPGQTLSVRITGSAREALEFERIRLRLMAIETVPGRHGPRQQEIVKLEVTVVEDDVHLQKGQSVSYQHTLELPPDTAPTTGSAQHSLTYELRAEAVSGFELRVGSARRSLTVQCCRARSGGMEPHGHEERSLARTYKSDLLFGLFPVGSQVGCSVTVDSPVYESHTGFMLGDRVSGTLAVSSRKSYPEARLWWGVLVKGGGKTDRNELGGPLTVPLEENQVGRFSFNLPDRAAASYNGHRVDYEWYLRVDLTDLTGSHHREDFQLVVLPRVQPRTPPKPRQSLTRPRTSSTTPQGLSTGTLQGLTRGGPTGLQMGAVTGLVVGDGGGLRRSPGPPTGLQSSSLRRPPPARQEPPPEEGGPPNSPGPPTGLQSRPEEPPPAEAPPPPKAVPPPVVQPKVVLPPTPATEPEHDPNCQPALSPEVVQYLAKIVQSSPFFANMLPDDLANALSSPEALKGHLTPELRQVLEAKLKQNPQIARVLPPHLVGAVAASRNVDQAEAVVTNAFTERLLQKLQEHPRVGVALKYIVINFPGFKKKLPSAVLDALPDGPGKIDLGALGMLLNEFPEMKKHVPAGMLAMLNSRKK